MPAGETYVKIASQTLTSATASVNFTNIPQTFTDIILVIQGFNTTNAAAAKIQFNADTGSNYSTTWLEGTSSGASSGRESNQSSIFVYYNGGASTNGTSTAIVNINNYSNNATNKIVTTRFGNIAQAGVYAGLWRNTNAITSLVINAITQNFQTNSIFTIYGIAASVAPQASGGTITTDGTYWIHTFTSSGVFTPISGLNSEILVVAGGGGGASAGGTPSSRGAGGGGAGGYRTFTSYGLSQNKSYIVTIGSGGSGGAGGGRNNGTSGQNSTFDVLSSTGGGFGTRQEFATAAGSGGSGGGGGNLAGAGGTGNAGNYSPVEGYAGGTGTPNVSGGAGGGGSSGVGQSNDSITGSPGGSGTANSITGSSVTYAAGGAGGNSNGGSGSNGSSNTGNGGQGGSGSTGGFNPGGNGGSGIVIVRYPR